MGDQDGERRSSGRPRQRRTATVREAKALAHPLRLRILRLCAQQELTNKQLADRLGSEPGTIFYHVRQLVDAGFLRQAPVRTGDSGALEKPYRSTGRSWWLDDPLSGEGPEAAFAPIEAFQDELREAGPGSVKTSARFMLHLSPEDVVALDRRILAIIDEYLETEDQRLDQPVHGGIVILHRLAE
ncbi:ArsR/SmtB family transcription factor [Streptosporangium lutulentum]|uniref:DNA-binding transcriptional ArsR family regulator n=1 Tax=Streptosporangium lutulentum TaxID=1461250 RepID=A0ABT9QPF3_9ACTN|nr:helix-turn-helix domain-containing protein [Streptosporangium lutulentum]MDP9848626.1 DNA-binding transcriptional ArsR family regulator [Streptosporangium lutulentum]